MLINIKTGAKTITSGNFQPPSEFFIDINEFFNAGPLLFLTSFFDSFQKFLSLDADIVIEVGRMVVVHHFMVILILNQGVHEDGFGISHIFLLGCKVIFYQLQFQFNCFNLVLKVIVLLFELIQHGNFLLVFLGDGLEILYGALGKDRSLEQLFHHVVVTSKFSSEMFDGIFEMGFLRGDGVAAQNGSESEYLVVSVLQFFLLDFQENIFFVCCIFGVDLGGLGVGYKFLDRFEIINQFHQFLPMYFSFFLKILNNFPFFFNQINFIFMTASQSTIQIFNHIIKRLFIFLMRLQFQMSNFEVMGFFIKEIGESLGLGLK